MLLFYLAVREKLNDLRKKKSSEKWGAENGLARVTFHSRLALLFRIETTASFGQEKIWAYQIIELVRLSFRESIKL